MGHCKQSFSQRHEHWSCRAVESPSELQLGELGTEEWKCLQRELALGLRGAMLARVGPLRELRAELGTDRPARRKSEGGTEGSGSGERHCWLFFVFL